MKYPFNVYFTQVEEHKFWIAECKTLRGCVGQGETIEEAIAELEQNAEEWIKTAEEFEIEIPEIPIEYNMEYSGKFTVRVSPHIHGTAVEIAKKQGISLNQYVNDAILAYNSSISTLEYINVKVKEEVEKIQLMIKTSNSFSTSQKLSLQKQSYTISSSYIENCRVS